ncbi:MAG: 2-amino-4-hydroxy-6-hydroxymethyldihydropteridine diphosphokinase, partial [Alphaproteobacteria bacterium]
MILLALGANLPSPAGPPRLTLEAALKRLRGAGVEIASRSRWYRSRAHPQSSQPDYVNGVIAVKTRLPPEGLLELMHKIEWDFGRRRGVANAARMIDLDLLD